MKIRIKENSVRLRLTQNEVDEFNRNGHYEQRCCFGPSPTGQLTYGLTKKEGISELSAHFESGNIKVYVPASMGEKWATTEEVGMENHQGLHDGSKLRILVEKDFQCLKPRPEEDETDNFPHPEAVQM